MQPNSKDITINDNENLIKQLLEELVLFPRVKALSWSGITKQTPNMKIGYPGQHLASLITGVEGSRTGARGDDLLDGTEVKSCSRVDQLDTCKNCRGKVLRIELKCPHCNSENIKRMADSKWLFSMKSDEEVYLLTKKINRVFLTLADYPDFDNNNFNTIRFQAFEIWNHCKRHQNFSIIMNNYYKKIFLEHIKNNPNKTPAPKNFWPYSYQFYLCNPVKVFEAIVKHANSNPIVNIKLLVSPNESRKNLIAEKMPTNILKKNELLTLADHDNQNTLKHLFINNKNQNDLKRICQGTSINKKNLSETLPFLDEQARSILGLRDTDKISTARTAYSRR